MAILLILGGIFSILPVLGLWMLPLGLLLFAQDVPLLQTPMAQHARMDRAQVDRTSARKKHALNRSSHSGDSIFAIPSPVGLLAAQCDSKSNFVG